MNLCLKLCVTATLLLAGPVALADTYEVDPVHSSVVFRVKHSQLNDVFGLFADTKGTFTLDGEGSFDIKVAVDSINSGNATRDQHLKAPDYFSAEQFPHVIFKSLSAKEIDDSTLEVVGNLTMRGVTKPVKAKISKSTGTGRGGESRGGISTTFTINRTEFGVGGTGGLGEEVTLMVSLQGVKK